MKFLLMFVFLFTSMVGHAYPAKRPTQALTTLAVTVLSGAQTTAAVDLNGYELVGIKFPATLTSTTVGLTMSDTFAGTFVPVYNSAGAVSYTIAQARYYNILASDTQGLQYIKVTTGSAEGADRILTLILRAVR